MCLVCLHPCCFAQQILWDGLKLCCLQVLADLEYAACPLYSDQEYESPTGIASAADTCCLGPRTRCWNDDNASTIGGRQGVGEHSRSVNR